MNNENKTWPLDVHVLIPAYKAESELRQFLPALCEYVPSAQITVVIDGVYDKSESFCQSMGVRILIHETNRGKGQALVTGFSALDPQKTAWVITMDADGQHSPHDLPTFLEAIRSVDPRTAIIMGKRTFQLLDMPIARIFSNRSTSGFISLVTGQKIPDTQCGYRAYRVNTAQSTPCRYVHFEMESEILLRVSKAGYRIESVPVQTLYTAETSHISHVWDTLRWIRSMLTTLVEMNGKR